MDLESISQLNDEIFSAEKFCFITRDWDLQVEQIKRLASLYHRCEEIRLEAIASNDEDNANIALGFQLVAMALVSELQMYLHLKKGEPDKAWDALIMSQSATSSAVRSHPAFENCTAKVKRLEIYEDVFFPPQHFLSAGLRVSGANCSICKDEYGNCDHIAGRAYWGQLCSMEVYGMKPDHVAIMKDPADKRCRVVKIVEDKGIRNVMTSLVENSDEDFAKASYAEIEDESSRVLKVVGIIMYSNSSI